MKKLLLFTTLLLALSLSAQNYQWIWAKRGGGIKMSPNETTSGYNYDSEQVQDIAVDNDNNYYFLVYMTQQNTEFDGTAVTVYNPTSLGNGSTDIVLISTDCSGALRWTRTIGEGGRDYAHKIVLDNNGGLYIGVSIFNQSNSLDEYLPPRFGTNDVMPVLGPHNGQPQEGYKTAALLKYNTANGELLWRVMPQGDVTLALRYAHISSVQIASDGTVHTLIGLLAGSHLNGQVVVPDSYTGKYRYHIVKFNSAGNLVSFLPLTLEGGLIEHYTKFRYDENLQRYYVGGFRNYGGGTGSLVALSFNNVPFTQQAFLLSFDIFGNEVWRKEVFSTGNSDKKIYGLEIDSESNIYVTGKYSGQNSSTTITFGEYSFPYILIGNVVFVLKLNPAGVVQWMKQPTGYTGQDAIFTGSHYAYNLLMHGNDVIVATEGQNENWGEVSINRPVNYRSDPVLLRLNKNTGAATALHDVMGAPGFEDAFTAVALDNDGNYVTGGYFHSDLFTSATDNVPTLQKVNNQQNYTDFFIAKFAASACGVPAGTDNFEQGNIQVYPNPAREILNIHADEQIVNYTIVNLLGQVVLKGKLETTQSHILIERLTPGTYILNLGTANGKTYNQKIVKE